MTRALQVRSEAEAELAEAIKWYESKTVGLGSEFLLCVDAVMNAIQREPESHPQVHKNIRRALVRRFP